MGEKTGRLFVLDGPAGTGKSAIAQQLLSEPELGLTFCPRVTSRERRQGEEEPFEYRFISEDEFDKMVERDEFAAYRVFLHGVSYGLPRSGFESLLAQGRDVLTIVDTGTGEQIKARYPESITVFVISPVAEIEKRLRNLGIYGPDQIRERVQNASNSLSLAPYYDFVVVNRQDRLEQALDQVRGLVRSHLTGLPRGAG